jgi:AraC-like DNA-binding protein
MIVSDIYIRATQLIGLTELVEGSGIDPMILLDEAGIARAAMTDVEMLIPYRGLVTLLEMAAQRLGRPDFGLEWSMTGAPDFPALGPLALLANFVSTISEWNETSVKYWRFHTNAFTMRLITDPATGDAILRYYGDPFVMPARQISEMILGNVCMMTRSIIGLADENPKLIRFQHSQPKQLATHEQAFRCPIEFNADHMEIVFRPEILQAKTNGSLRLLKPLVGRYIKYRIARMPIYDSSMTTTVALAIPGLLGTGHCGIDTIAESLGMHTKRLQRALSDEGTNFSEIIEKVRDNMARRLLVETDMSVERISGLLDYSSTPPFTLAFKRWTEYTPLAFRKRERARLGRPGGPANQSE